MLYFEDILATNNIYKVSRKIFITAGGVVTRTYNIGKINNKILYNKILISIMIKVHYSINKAE